MNTVENALLQQMQKLSASLTAMQSGAGKDKNTQNAVSFQEMLQQSGSKTNNASASEASGKENPDKPVKEGKEGEEAGEEKVPVLKKEKEELKPEQLTANPNAVNVLSLVRPEIVEATEQTEAVLNPIPQETVEGAAMDLTGQGAELETGVDAGIGAEVSMGQQTGEFQQAMEETPQQSAENVQTRQEAPQRTAQETDKVVEEPEVRVEREETEEPGGEMAVEQQPVFHEAQAAPIKVGERYEAVDTQKPEMDDQMANVIRAAVQTGQDHVEIRLNPQNLGSLVIEMTKDTAGVLQVVLHAATPKAEGLLNQHLNGLHSALQGYGHEEVRLEVQRGEESQQQNFRQADPDGRGQHHNRQQQERQEEQSSGEEFMQKLRLGLFGMDE